MNPTRPPSHAGPAPGAQVPDNCRRSVLGPQPKGTPRTTTGRSDHQPCVESAGRWTYSPADHRCRRQATWSSSLPTSGCREPSGLLPTMQWSPGTGPTLRPGWSRRRQARASSFVSAVPPTCHKQRSPAVRSGQSRSLRGGRWAGCPVSDLGWGSRPKLHGMQEVKARRA
jgi:hypothetical protein